MTSPIDNEKLAPTGSRARLPALGAPEPTQDFLGRVKETLEILTGQRGAASNWDRAVTFRDLNGQEIQLGDGFSITAPGQSAIPGMPAAVYQQVLQQLQLDLRESAAFKELTRRIGSAEDLAIFPDEFRVQLQQQLGDVARQRQADILTFDQKVQTSQLSIASRLNEITAALDHTAAGVREFNGAYADSMRAVATSIKQVVARMDNVGGVTVEEKFTAQADINTGLLGQWSVKIQTGSDANPIIAGIALSAQGPHADQTTSSLVFMADKFGFFTNNGTVMPFGIDSAGHIFVNGQLVVNAGGSTLDQMTAGMINFVGDFASAPAAAGYRVNDVYKNTADGNSYILKLTGGTKTWTLFLQKGTAGSSAKSLALSASSQIFQITKAGANAPGSITLTASAQNLAGSPNWTIPAGTATLSAGADAFSKVLTFANMATDTVTIQVAQDGLADTITIAKVREGVDSITGLLTNEAATLTADSQGTVSSFAGSGGTFKLFDGSNDKTGDAAVAYSVASASAGLTIAITAAGTYSITGLTADQGSATLRAVYRGVTIDKIYTISKSKTGGAGAPGAPGAPGSQGSDGVRGTVNIAAGGYTSWSDIAATNAVINAGYGYPQERDVVTLYGTGYSETRFRTSFQWLTMAAYINGNMLVTGTLSAGVLRGGTISGVTMNINGNFVVYADGTSQLYTANLTRCTASNGDAPGIAAFTARASGSNTFGNGAALKVDGGGYGNAIEIVGGTNGIVQNGAGVNWLRTTVPNAQNAFDCGSNDFAWRNIYTYGSVITVSDRRLKTDIQLSQLGLDFINALRPVSYLMVLGHNEVVDHVLEGPDPSGAPLDPYVEVIPRPGVRRHYGLIAQEVRATLVEHGADDAAFWTLNDPEDPDSGQALRYEELISPMIRAIQQLHATVEAQQKQIDQLTSALAAR